MSDSEIVGYLKLTSETPWCAFDLGVPEMVASLIEEVHNLIDGSYLPDQVDDDNELAWITIEVRRKPKGYVDSLPEFEGW